MNTLPYKPTQKFTCALHTGQEFLLARDPFARLLALSVEPRSSAPHSESLLGFVTVLIALALFAAWGLTR